ncbi:DNA-packaging protein [Paenibacillus sp. FSL H7-0326]|uniref:head-tail connector protein n=1 Tax=Paenibacillus sp. FSL H7-0326 TaxID=1921144 RepID=UPI00096FD1E8|nr:head-tail connector protein [Paenibacillus sp. FSL H7-0326]OMC71355.1 DNA-packaging protein [Paenibacillus sp. FSL H7-0326]
MPLIDQVKLSLRISSAHFDDEINGLIEAARKDLVLSGLLPIKAEDDNDPLIKRAVTVYVKAHFGYDNSDHERLLSAYGMIKNHLTLSAEYTVGELL